MASEYALGLLDPDERRAVAAALETDPEMRAELSLWESRLPALLGGLDEVAPPPALKASLEARLFGEEPRSLWDDLLAPENRGLVLAALAAKAGLLAVLLHLLL
ncbi:hypothetical protein OCH239_08790 [Roseivivax halodurans JCM 10272]|uniref:Anti-sigma factor n=1 Tax=Roseivivax halodurans JCM 10272 TaxID=1449350 RepID=X7EM36_9RHOB|nr:hypothetical protein OCH239_08790 [Roseivivax halodurans JCM 10272]